MSPEDLLAVCETKMPFGKYQGRWLCDLPEPYLLWFAKKGFPQGRLGELMQLVMVIKENGLESLLTPIKQKTLS